ncbi:unnamed protein product [Closterium sp. Yama58-4]|nr:unnamed protein product [Closterium sp. Yama58-4]
MGRRRNKQSRRAAATEGASGSDIPRTPARETGISVSSSNVADWRLLHFAARDGDLARVQDILNLRFGFSTPGNPGGADLFEISEPIIFTAGTLGFPVGNTVTPELTEFVNSRDPSGKTALHEACAHGHAQIARLLLSLGALPAARKANGFTPLLCAAAGGHAECARLLLAHMRAGEKGGKIGAETAGNGAGGSAGGGSASAWRAADRCGENALHLAARAGAEEVVGVLLDAAEREDKHVGLPGETPGGEGANGEEGVRRTGTSASPTSISAPDSPPASESTAPVYSHTRSAVSPFVNSESHSHLFVNARTRNGRTPLHSACLHGHVAVCELLLKHGANPRARDSSGSEPIHEAAAGGHVAIIHLLAGGTTTSGLAKYLPQRTQTNTKAESLTVVTAQAFIPDELDDSGSMRALVDASSRKTSGGTSVDVNSRDASGATAFHRAAAAGHVDAMRALSLHGAPLDPLDNAGTTPLYWAASRGHVAAVEWLLEQQEQDQKGMEEGAAASNRGDDCRCSKDRTNSKRSALHVAVGWGHVGVCSLLLASGRFEPLQKDSNGLTALDIANQLMDERKRVEIIKSIRDYHNPQ